MYYDRDLLTENLKKNGLSLPSEEAYELFEEYACILLEKNKVMNLTAITDPSGIAVKHFADSLALLHFIDKYHIESIADIGTGAGFPGIPLKIMRPDIKITLADSLEKRVRFLDEVISKLGLLKIETVHARAEDMGREKKHRESYQLVTARAVAPLNILAEYCLPLTAEGGFFGAMKGQTPETGFERSIRVLGGTFLKEETYEIFSEEVMTRRIYFIKKTSPTPAIYPRKSGTPQKKPL